MFQNLLDSFLKNWRILALTCAALLVAGFLFYLWAFDRGRASCEAGQANANQEATETIGKANQDALGKELKASADRVKSHTETKRAIEENADESADSPAPALDQLFYDRLRGQGQVYGQDR